ncbi:MAG: type VI secretion system baseplate subunit TssG [Gammaproteobacteria bacterium]|nr:type VI secretion system baseplate subunit TssG [Gammaproteobacteria bacterium]
MASKSGSTTSNIAHELLNHGRHYDFFQAVKILISVSENKAPIGGLGPAREEPLRFRANASLGFPSADIDVITVNERARAPDDQIEIVANFLGLYGPSSPLPAFFTEEILFSEDKLNNRRDFLDLFNHRAISLLYRCWEKYRYYLQYRLDASDKVSQYMFSFIGLGDAKLRSEIDLDWRKLLSYLGVISTGCRSATVLQGIISHYFNGINIDIEQCVPRNIEIDNLQLCQLGIVNTTLGVDTYAAGTGSRIIDRNSKFRVALKDLSFDEFKRYLPTGDRYDTLCNLIKLVMSDQYEFDFELTQAEKNPRLELTTDNECRLGWSAWLGEPPEKGVSVLIAA